MDIYKLIKFDILSGASKESNNSGQIAQQAKVRKLFSNTETGEVFITTDLASRKFKRNKYIKNFINTYRFLFKEQKISILSFVVNESKYTSVSKFINMLGKKLRRKSVEKLGYVWVRDVGDVKFECHFHVLVATSRIDSIFFHELLTKKKNSNYDVEFLRNPKGLMSYLTNKELFGVKRSRAFGKSILFKKQINTH